MKVLSVCVLVLALCSQLGRCEEPTPPDDGDHIVKISPVCASVLLVGSGALGVAAASYIAPVALCQAGFCATGIAGGSFASLWQSTVPLVAKGSLFSILQSISMGGGVGTSITVSGAVVGGSIGASHINDFCTFVDETAPNSVLGKAFANTHAVIASETMGKATSLATGAASSLWNSVSSAASTAASYGQLWWETSTFGLTQDIQRVKKKFGGQSYNLILQNPHAVKEAGLRLIFEECSTDIDALSRQIEDKRAKDAEASVDYLENKIRNRMEDFGLKALDYLQQHRGESPLDPPELEKVYHQAAAKIRALEKRIKESEERWARGEL